MAHSEQNVCLDNLTAEDAADFRDLASVKSKAGRATFAAWLNDAATQIEGRCEKDEGNLESDTPAENGSKEQPAVTPSAAPVPTPTATSTPHVVHKQKVVPQTKLTSYAWDQTPSVIKIYASLAEVESLPADAIQVTYPTDKSFVLDVANLNGKNFKLAVDLAGKINASTSTFKARKGRLILTLKKEKEGKWDVLTMKEKRAADAKKSKSKSKADEDPQASIMNMMRDMYQDGDDDMKRLIGKAWTDSRDKNKQPGDDL